MVEKRAPDPAQILRLLAREWNARLTPQLRVAERLMTPINQVAEQNDPVLVRVLRDNVVGDHPQQFGHQIKATMDVADRMNQDAIGNA